MNHEFGDLGGGLPGIRPLGKLHKSFHCSGVRVLILSRHRLTLATVAEIARAAGDYTAPAANDSARETEANIENRILAHDISRFASQRLGHRLDTHTTWTYRLYDEEDIEACFFRGKIDRDLKKMALARQLQLRGNLSAQQRDDIWELSKDLLMAAYRAGPDDGMSGEDLLSGGAAGGATVNVSDLTKSRSLSLYHYI